MSSELNGLIQECWSGAEVTEEVVLQSLWAGYGRILRCQLKGADLDSMILKEIRFSSSQKHPRNWDTPASHQRKLKSYQVERDWYRHWASSTASRIPQLYFQKQNKTALYLLLEDFDAAGFPLRVQEARLSDVQLGLEWLASFHAEHMGKKANGLWEQGTYWHLDTRQEEWSKMEPSKLKESAKAIDRVLRNARFQSIVHGDAKLANFCFSEDRKQIAALDFQYVGAGCGMKDVAYFIGSCLNESECKSSEKELLNCYFVALSEALEKRKSALDFEALEAEWRRLYAFAWADFTRFLLGWMPNHSKIHNYSKEQVSIALNGLSEFKED